MEEIGPDVLIFDCETRTFGKPNADKDILKVFGCYSYKTKKSYILTSKEDIQKIVKAHKFLVGFNIKNYDIPIIKRAGIDVEYKILVDMYEIFKSRAQAMKIKKGMLGDLLMSYSLDYISKTIGIVTEEDAKIKDFDYAILNKDHWTQEDLQIIKKYTLRDIEITKKMYEWVESYFESFKGFIREEDVRKKKYLTCSIASFAYKAICKAMKWEETYDSGERMDSYGGGFVAFPAGEKFDGDLLMFDYTSLYPNMFIQGNLFGNNCDCCTHDEKWHGDGFFRVEGYYCKKKLNPLGELLKKFYMMRKEMKKNKDPKNYSIKIIINTIYGCVSNPTFKRVYNLTAAKDCTSLGRQIIKYTRKRFKEEGYLNLMSDTDSVVVKVPEGKTKEDAEKLAQDIVNEGQKHFPFPW